VEVFYIDFLNRNGAETYIRYSTYTRKFYVSTKAEIKEGIILRGIAEHRDTPEEAIEAFNERIKGKLIVINAMRPNRKEMLMPDLILAAT